MAEYKVTFIKQIHGVFATLSSEDKWLKKEVVLPFPPVVGVTYELADWECTPVEVAYDIDTGTFRAFAEPNKEIYNAKLHHNDHRPIDEIVDEYLEYGWEAD